MTIGEFVNNRDFIQKQIGVNVAGAFGKEMGTVTVELSNKAKNFNDLRSFRVSFNATYTYGWMTEIVIKKDMTIDDLIKTASDTLISDYVRGYKDELIERLEESKGMTLDRILKITQAMFDTFEID